MVVGAPYKHNGTGPNEGAVYAFTPQGETWVEHAKLTASDGVFTLVFSCEIRERECSRP